MNSQVNRTDKFILIAAIAIFVLLHIYQINSPPNGYHQWRESDTAAIILNYYQEDANFMHQRCNQRGANSGITAGELPTYAYSSFILYNLFGPHHFLPRLLSLAGGLIALWFFRKNIKILANERVAIYSTIALAFSPMFLFYSFKIMPDMWMLMFLLGAVYYFLKYAESSSLKHFTLSAILMILSATTKPLSLCLYLPFLVYILNKSENKRQAFLKMAVYCAVTFSITLAWFLYGRYLNSIHQSQAIYMGENLYKSLELTLQPMFFKKLFLQWPVEIWIGWALAPAFIYGAIILWKNRQGRFLFIWIVASYIAFALVSVNARRLDYYTLVIVPPLAAISGWGLAELISKSKFRKVMIAFILIILPAVTAMRIYHRFAPVPEFDLIRADAQKHIPREALVIVQETTTSTRLYQMNRHGWPARDELTLEKIQTLIEMGGNYLVLDSPIEINENDLKTLVTDSAIQIGPLYGYRTIKPD